MAAATADKDVLSRSALFECRLQIVLAQFVWRDGVEHVALDSLGHA
jgi:hypothetical protein